MIQPDSTLWVSPVCGPSLGKSCDFYLSFIFFPFYFIFFVLHIIFKRLCEARGWHRTPDLPSLGETCRRCSQQCPESGSQAGDFRAPCFTPSLNSGQAGVLVPLCCTVRHVNPLGCCLPTAQLVSNIINEDGNENSKLAFAFCMLNSLLAFLLKKPHILSH